MAILLSPQLVARSSQVALLALTIALASCEEAAAPEGSPGDLTVAAYIDNDASGSLTAGDTPLAGFEIALFDESREIATAQTAADGRVTFSDLAPGSYRVEPAGTPPTGVTLTSNPSPSAVIDFRGRPVSVDFRYAMFPGLITGRVFRDENGNGTFESGTDVPGPGLWVFLRADTGAIGAKLDSVRTDSLGAYRFGLVAPGNYFLEFERAGTINYGQSGATRQIVVVGAATSTQNVLFTGSIFITVAAARATPVDTTVAVIGDVTAPPGVFTSGTGGVNSEIWLQDSTGGIAAFPVPTADSATLRLGTRIEVVGPITLFSGQRQIGRAAAPPAIRVRTGGSVVMPKSITVLEARTRADEGRLVVVAGLTVVSLGTGTSAFNVNVVSDAGDTLVVRVNGAATGLTRSSFTVGAEYNITGLLTQFNGTAQLKPRVATDVVQVVRTPIATARTQAVGTLVTVLGDITAPPGVFNGANPGVNSEVWVQDSTGGIAVFSILTADSVTYRLGDRIEVTGTLGLFSGQLQIASPPTPRPTVIKKFGNTIIAPKVITGAEVNARTDEGKLIRVTGLVVTAVGGGTSNAFNVTTTAPDGQTVVVRINGLATGLTRANFVVGNTYDVTGILTQFAAGTTVTAQIKPRFRTDVQP
jgi:DNA/RNA endonuclease YhcR with UshA esterase domain